jgi:pyruvate,water dikinase
MKSKYEKNGIMGKFCFFIQFVILIIPGFTVGQTVLTGKVVDTYTQNPISGVEVSLLGGNVKATTDNMGYFSLETENSNNRSQADFELKPISHGISWSSKTTINIRIVNILGQETGLIYKSLSGNGEINLAGIADGIYLLSLTGNGINNLFKINKAGNALNISKCKSGSIKNPAVLTDTLLIIKNEYYSQKFAYHNAGETFDLLKLKYDDIEYLNKISRYEAFTQLQGMPLNSAFSEVKSIKIIYSIPDKKIYYSNSQKYFIHYDFCYKVLGYTKGHQIFNLEQYSKNPNRIYILASLNHFTSSDIYTLEFFAGDELDCTDIATVYDKVTETFWYGDKLRFYPNSMNWAKCTNVQVISSDELYKGQNYQPLNPQENYGYLKKIEAGDLATTYLGRHDIVLLNTIPIDISVVAGIITTEFQTPLSHINVLSHNRGTPNMALRDGWTNAKLNNLLDKLVYLKVSLDTFIIKEASLEEAKIFWAQKEPQTPHVLKLDTITSGLVDLTSANVNSVTSIGGKAANFAELTKINVSNYGPIPLPEGYFAIPFSYYWHHIMKYGLDIFIDAMLKDPLFQSNASWRQKQLKILQDSIKRSPIDTSLLNLVIEHVSSSENFTSFRFRSSTNAEDIEGFNGAGLYESYTGSLSDPGKPIDKAIKNVWASLWGYGAFEERDYFKIDHRTVSMGILVHRSYPAEAANGVVITQNLYNPNIPAITINVQIGEISVVKPDEKYFPDQIIYYTFSDENIFEYINHSNVPGMEGNTVMTDDELKVLKDFCMAIHYHYCKLNFECKPIDIEFKVEVINGERKIYIKQARLY